MSSSRRSFLKGSLALLGTSFLPRFSQAESGETYADASTVYDCIIIGAGPAGMTAARNLSLCKIKGRSLKVLVLEGSDRIGGRMFTDRTKATDFGAPLELGAEYIHVAPGVAPIWDEVERYKLSTKVYPKFLKGYIYNSEFLGPVPRCPVSILGHLHFSLLKSYRIFKDIDSYDGRDISGAAFIRLMNYEDFTKESAQTLLTGHLGAPLDKVSIRGMQKDHIVAQLKGNNEYYVEGGYDRILRGMMAEIPQGRVVLNSPVRQITSTKNGLVQAYVPGTGWFTARSLLSTVSVGMLQSGAMDFGEFWTKQKQDALSFINTAHQMKVSIRFKSQFWDEKMCMLNQLEASERRTGMTYFVPNYNEDRAPVLTALISGDPAKRLLSLSDSEILQLVCKDLDDMYKLPSSTYKKISHRKDGSLIYSCKKWMQDPFAKGGISHLRVHDCEGDVDVSSARAALAKSTGPVFWAGEATSLVQQPASVHGAHSTGLRAYSEIYNYLQQRS